MDDELFSIICLLNIKGLGLIKASRIFQNGETANYLSQHPQNDEIRRFVDQELHLAEKLNVKLISLRNPSYPSPLLKLADPPLVLYVAGDPLKYDNGLGIIGTRQATHYGREMAERFGEDLADQGFTIISGLARGIDTAAHRGALKKGVTAAILGSGLANIYPKENEELARQIAHKGTLISEFSLRTPPHAYNFPRRNRLVSCLSQALVLIEAPLKSGAMGTMELGRSQGRPLFTIPGRADIESFRGNHALIKQGTARLVETPDEVIAALGHKKVAVSRPTAPSCTEEEAKLLAVLPSEEVSFDWICGQAGIVPAALNTLLMRLLLKGLIREYPNKNYRRVIGNLIPSISLN